MNKETIMGLCASRDNSITIGIFRISRDEFKEIKKIDVYYYKNYEAMNYDNNMDIIKDTIANYNPYLCMIDTYGVGIKYYNLIKPFDNIKVIQMNSIRLAQFSSYANLLKDYIQEDIINIDNLFSKDIIDLYFRGELIYDSRQEKEEKQKHIYMVKNLAEMIGNLSESKNNYIYQERKEKVEIHLTEMINIFMDALNETDRKDKDKVNDLVHLIDKANYMRGQF